MNETRAVYARGLAPRYPADAVVPNRWQGEADCLVGPFSSRDVAEYFASAVVDFGQYETVSRRIFAKGDAWFVEVSECRAAPALSSPSLS
jgi:hypothetical protein